MSNTINDYGIHSEDPGGSGPLALHPGNEIRLKANSPHAHLTGSERLGRVEQVKGSKLLVRLKNASFWLDRSEIVRRGISE